MSARDYALNVAGISGNSPVVSSQGTAPEVLKLASQLTRQRYSAGIGAPQAPGSGVMGKIFDLIQRPLYASANTVDYAVKGKSPLTGTLRGLTGQDKTSYDQVLGDMGMSGGWQRSLAGFGLDVALDPTTYTGLGIEKNVAEGVARKAAVEASGEAIAKSAGESIVKSTAKSIAEGSKVQGGESAASKAARQAHFKNFDMSGMSENAAYRKMMETAPERQFDTVQQISNKQARKMAEEQAKGNALSSILEKNDQELAKQRGKVYLKFMGKQTPIASEGLYKAGRAAADVTRDLPVVKGFNAAFRPTYNMPQGLNTIVRNAESHGIHMGEERLRNLARMVGKHVTDIGGEKWGGLSEGEAANVMRAISSGTQIEGAAAATGRPLQQYADFLKNETKTLWGNETELGLRGEKARAARLAGKIPENFREDYVPTILRGGSKAEQDAFKKGIRAGLPGHTLADAEAKGLNPVLDPLEAYGQKTIKSFRLQTPARVNKAASEEFGVHLNELAPGKVRNRIGKQLANDLGLKPYTMPGFPTSNVYFPPEIGDALKKSYKTFTDPAAGGDLLRYFDKVQQAWKLNMTALNPGHHIRNFGGDVYLNFEDGLKNPARYTDSAKVLQNWRDNPTAFKMTIGNMDVDAGRLMDLFTRNGGKSGFFRQEYAQTAKGIQGVVRHPVESIRQAAEMREDWTRMAHFLDVMDKGGAKGIKASSDADLEALAKEAGQRVRKFNIDYGDLTPFEKNTMKRVVPFYTWMRKNIPLQLETLAMDPSKISVVPKGLRALQSITGQQPDTQSVLGLNTVPQWLREMAGVRVAGEGVGRNQIYWNPNIIPSTDIGQYFGSGSPTDIGRQFLSGLTPMARVPIEQATGRMLSSGAPVGNLPTYLGQQVLPPSTYAAKAIATGKGEPTDIGKLLGVSLYNVGPQQQLGELRRQQDIVTALLKARKKQQPRSWESG
jgi:hypothetical protein